MKFVRYAVLLSLLLFSGLFAGTTGKIAGQVKDAQSGEALPGVNVFLDGTSLGAATDVDGYYVITNITPGVYTVKFSYVGYAEYTVKDVQVQIDLTTTLNADLRSELLSTEEVVVVAKKPVIQKDVAGSSKNISAKEVQALPVSSIQQVVGLQAGITSGLSIRGSSSSQMLFVVDGISMRDTRTNQPISDIPLSAMQDISVQTGGFGAEYSNVRSGVVNVVSKEGSASGYSATVTYKYHPPQPKHFGISPYDANSFWMRPYLDDDVAWTGTTNGAWDSYTRRQYPDFDGWNAISQSTLTDDDPTNDLTPDGAKRLFLWQNRKNGDIQKPDYDLDGGFGGPVPFVSKMLGNLRFFFSFKQQQNMYLIRLATDAQRTQSYMLRLTSDLTPTLKLSLMGLHSKVTGTSASRSGLTSMFTSTYGVANNLERVGFTAPWRFFTDTYWSQTARYSDIWSLKLTDAVNDHSFWDVKLTRTERRYFTGPLRDRNTEKKYEIFDGYFVDEAPVGYYRDPVSSVEGRLAMGGAVSMGRDTSRIKTTSLAFNYTNQVNRHNEVKAGASLVYEQYDMNFGSINYFLPEGNTWTTIKQDPLRGTAYIQDKLEFEGFIANAGLIIDYYNSNNNWYNVSPYSREFFSDNYKPEDESKFLTRKAESRVTFSPRLSISHPITENSKLFFNYGHYRQMPTSERLYRVQRDSRDQLDYIGDPSITPPKTVAYELGYDHALFNQYLFRIAAYYKDISDQEFWVRYLSFDGKVNYRKITSNSYEDIRGFEVDLTKRSGKWLTGNVNFEYRVGTSGYFGVARYYENPADQAEYERRNPTQFKPRPIPRVKSYLDFHTPVDFGPKVLSENVAGDWHFNFISYWAQGSWFSWNPQHVPGIKYNVQWKDYFNMDLRIAKIFSFDEFDVKFFADITNLFNIKHFSGVSFEDTFDYNDYMQSLHLPEDVTDKLNYGSIPGNDQPGDYRPAGVDFVPMEWRADLNNETNPSTRAIYYDASTKRFMSYNGTDWAEVDGSRLNKVLDEKAYIDMPNQTYFTFLNPRSMFTGVTLTYHF